MVEMAVRAVSGSTEFQIILEGHGAEWSRQKWYGWNPHILGSSKHHPELPADASGHDNPKQFDLTALLSRDFGMLSSDDSRNLYISVGGRSPEYESHGGCKSNFLMLVICRSPFGPPLQRGA